MAHIKLLLPLGLALSALLPTATALGCYNGDGWIALESSTADFTFNQLHSDPNNWADDTRDLRQEVINDINTQCRSVDGASVKPGSKWTKCTDWAWEKSDGTVASGNRIEWEIKHGGVGDDTRTMTYDICNTAFNAELAACEHGSESEHNAFWFRIDPNPGHC